MKKNFIYLFMFTLGLVGLAGCGSDDDEPKVETKAVATYSLAITDDVRLACQAIEITWMGSDNRVNTSIIAGTNNWTQTVTTTKFDAKLGFKIRPIPKAEADLTKESYDLRISGAMSVSISGESTSSRTFNRPSLVSQTNATKSKAIRLLEDADGRGIAVIAEKDGSIDETTPSKIF